VSWFRRAAEAGHADAQYNLGAATIEWRWSRKDAKQAVAWFRRAAEAGDASAQFNLGCVLPRKVMGFAEDGEQAVVWYRRAAESGRCSTRNAYWIKHHP